MVSAGQAGVAIATVGKFTGSSVKFGASDAPLADLATIYRSAFAEKAA